VKQLDRREAYACSSRDIQQIIDNGLEQRDSHFAANCFRWNAGDQGAVGSRRGFGFAEDLNPVVDLFFEFVFVDEAVDLHGAEEVADAFADAACGDFLMRREGRSDRVSCRPNGQTLVKFAGKVPADRACALRRLLIDSVETDEPAATNEGKDR